MSGVLICPHCSAQAMTARDKWLWIEPSRAIPCAGCGQRLSIPFWCWTAGGIPLYVLLILVFTGLMRSWPLILLAAAVAIAIGSLHKVFLVRLVSARRSASTAAPWFTRRRR